MFLISLLESAGTRIPVDSDEDRATCDELTRVVQEVVDLLVVATVNFRIPEMVAAYMESTPLLC